MTVKEHLTYNCSTRMGVHIPAQHAFFEYDQGGKGVIQRLIYTLVQPILLTLDMYHMQFVKIFSLKNFWLYSTADYIYLRIVS